LRGCRDGDSTYGHPRLTRWLGEQIGGSMRAGDPPQPSGLAIGRPHRS
jgi:hypothetical protein